MEDVVKIFGSNIPCVLAFELTTEKKKILSWKRREYLKSRREREFERGVRANSSK